MFAILVGGILVDNKKQCPAQSRAKQKTANCIRKTKQPCEKLNAKKNKPPNQIYRRL